MVQVTENQIKEFKEESSFRSFPEIVDHGIKNRATNLGFRSGEWRERIKDTESANKLVQEIATLIKDTPFQHVLKLDGTLSQHGLVRLIDMIWDRRRSGIVGNNEELFTAIALKVEKLFDFVAEDAINSEKVSNNKSPDTQSAEPEKFSRSDIQKTKQKETESPDLSNYDKKLISIMQPLMDRYTKGSAPFKAKDLVDICNEEGVDPRLAFLMFWKESHWGTAGRAKRTFNPGNVGNTDSGAHRYMGRASDNAGQRFLDGIRGWCRFMKQGYETTLEGFIESGGIRTKGGNIGASYARNNYSRALAPLARKLGLME